MTSSNIFLKEKLDKRIIIKTSKNTFTIVTVSNVTFLLRFIKTEHGPHPPDI